jgi:hypothetical protein
MPAEQKRYDWTYIGSVRGGGAAAGAAGSCVFAMKWSFGSGITMEQNANAQYSLQ